MSLRGAIVTKQSQMKQIARGVYPERRTRFFATLRMTESGGLEMTVNFQRGIELGERLEQCAG